jgi:hypothetical protein
LFSLRLVWSIYITYCMPPDRCGNVRACCTHRLLLIFLLFIWLDSKTVDYMYTSLQSPSSSMLHFNIQIISTETNTLGIAGQIPGPQNTQHSKFVDLAHRPRAQYLSHVNSGQLRKEFPSVRLMKVRLYLPCRYLFADDKHQLASKCVILHCRFAW